jgi:microcompartment protein CcmL/EutN
MSSAQGSARGASASAGSFVAVGAVETSSIAQGVVTGDAMVKTAEVQLLQAVTLSPGKYWVLIGGEVATVRAALKRGVEVAADTLLDSLFIPQLHDGVLRALAGTAVARDDDAIGIIETLTAASAIEAADAAAKAANVVLRDLRLANGIGGKGVVYLTGDVSNVQAAVEAGRALAHKKSMLSRSVVVPRLHAQMKERIL